MQKVSDALLVALKDCANYPRGNYLWKPKSMEKLAAMGLVEEVPTGERYYRHIAAYAITEAGRAALAGEKE